jgi:hypothetical protein
MRVCHLLMDLFAQVLSEYGRSAPALTDVIIEMERFEHRLVAVFSNEHRASVAVRPDDFYAFCERHSAWNLGSLLSSLTSEGRTIYGQMVESREVQINAAEQGHHDRTETPQVDTGSRLREWWNGPRFIRERRISPASERNAHARGVQLLTENLSPAQRDQYVGYGYFEVIGGDTGKRYRIKQGSQMNVEELDKKGKRVKVLCFMPKGGLVLGDVMLAQKLSLELFESQALAVANTIPERYHLFAIWADRANAGIGWG